MTSINIGYMYICIFVYTYTYTHMCIHLSTYTHIYNIIINIDRAYNSYIGNINYMFTYCGHTILIVGAGASPIPTNT